MARAWRRGEGRPRDLGWVVDALAAVPRRPAARLSPGPDRARAAPRVPVRPGPLRGRVARRDRVRLPGRRVRRRAGSAIRPLTRPAQQRARGPRVRRRSRAHALRVGVMAAQPLPRAAARPRGARVARRRSAREAPARRAGIAAAVAVALILPLLAVVDLAAAGSTSALAIPWQILLMVTGGQIALRARRPASAWSRAAWSRWSPTALAPEEPPPGPRIRGPQAAAERRRGSGVPPFRTRGLAPRSPPAERPTWTEVQSAAGGGLTKPARRADPMGEDHRGLGPEPTDDASEPTDDSMARHVKYRAAARERRGGRLRRGHRAGRGHDGAQDRRGRSASGA